MIELMLDASAFACCSLLGDEKWALATGKAVLKARFLFSTRKSEFWDQFILKQPELPLALHRLGG